MNNDSYKTIRNKMIIDRVIDNVLLAIKYNEGGLFGFNHKYDGDFSNMLNSIAYDRNILRFFKLLLAEFPQTRNEKLKLPDREVLDQFFHNFLSDIKMSLLKDALLNLSNYFVENINDKRNLDIKYELFYTKDKFEIEFKRFLEEIGIPDIGDITDIDSKLEDYEYILHCKVPIICFPWYAYALCYTLTKSADYSSGKELNIVKGMYLSLNSLDRNKYPSNSDYIEKPRKKLQAFLNALEDRNGMATNIQYNRSLNLHLFDETTDLYYIFHRLNIFRKQSMYLYMSINGREGLGSSSTENKARFNRMDSQLYGFGEFANISGLGNKIFLSANINEELMYHDRNWITNDDRKWKTHNDRILLTYNEVFSYCKKFLLKVIEKEHLSEYHEVPEDIRKDYCVYRLFKDDEPYLSILDQSLFEVPVDEEDSLLDEVSDSVPLPEDVNFLMNAAYYFLHKDCYDVQYKGQRFGNYKDY